MSRGLACTLHCKIQQVYGQGHHMSNVVHTYQRESFNTLMIYEISWTRSSKQGVG